ncbi:G-protein coupled receptor 176 isoform X2 [Oryzias melastigma]|uniref:G-protein coupled receptor 176 isoform X2 n=1 Tax=Oryzias melastigma TaxID=30732 RepID=UPI00168D7C91|nr:G-protein coupled receptor 176 isoform X2 [Oryzias melastigma]
MLTGDPRGSASPSPPHLTPAERVQLKAARPTPPRLLAASISSRARSVGPGRRHGRPEPDVDPGGRGREFLRGPHLAGRDERLRAGGAVARRRSRGGRRGDPAEPGAGARVPGLQQRRAGARARRFSARYYSVLYPLVRKLSDSRSRDLVVYIWVHAAVASLPVFAVASVTDVFAASSCSDGPSHSLGHMVYVLVYNLSTVALPLVLVLVLMLLVRRAISASQKKKVIIAALRTPQSSISIPYVSQREAELHASLLAAVLTFSACSAPYGALVVYRAVLADPVELSPSLYLTALWLPKLPLLTSPLLFLTINRSARHGWLGLLVRLQRRLSRRNAVSMGGRGSLEADSGGEEPAGLETAGRSGSQLLEMFNIGQQQIFRPEEEAEPKPLPQDAGSGSGSTEQRGGPEAVSPRPEAITEDSVPRTSPLHICTSSSQVAPATPTEPDDSPQFGFGPFELPPQWLPETRNSKKRLLPPLGNTPEELIQSKAPRPRPERRISRNNRVNTIPAVDP